MGGRGANAARGGRAGGGGGAFTVTPGANGGVTITPNNNAAGGQQFTGAGSGISDVKTHTTYFTPADKAIVSDDVTDGYRRSPRTGKKVPVGYYQTGDYANINGELRDKAAGLRTQLTPQTQKVADTMDRNMRPLNADMDTVRWTDTRAMAANLGMPGASQSQIIRRLSRGDVTNVKSDYTSSSWDAKANAVAGQGGRYVRIDMHYSKGALVQFSPTRKEGEVVGARNVMHRYSNARTEHVTVQNGRYGNRQATVLVVDCYVQ